MTRLPFSVFAAATLAVGSLLLPTTATYAAPVSLDLTTGASNKRDLGFFAAGTTITLSFAGNGDLVDARYQTRADGSLFAPATGGYEFANAGASYPALFGGDGVNHYVGGGAAYDFTGSGFGFAGTASTNTTDPTTIRNGAIVATFVGAPGRADWLFVGNSATLTAPTGGANLYLAVQDTVNSDNHGTYTGTITSVPVVVPEANTFALALPAVCCFAIARLGMIGAVVIRQKRNVLPQRRKK